MHNTCAGPDCRECEAIARVVEDMTQGDELIDVIGCLDPDQMARWDVAVLRWYRGDRDALDAVRGMFNGLLAERAADVLRGARQAA